MAEINILKTLCEERDVYREHLYRLWKKGGEFSPSDKAIVKNLEGVHAKIIAIEMADKKTIKTRSFYTVCGWDEKHNYFRNKAHISENYNEAIMFFENLKGNMSWRIPTVLIKETFRRIASPPMVDFDNDEVIGGFSDEQELIKKHMMGCTKHQWEVLIGEGRERYTY